MHVERGSATPAPPSVYDRIAPLYDLLYGIGLQPGRRRAMAQLAPKPGERVLEIGIGTGLGALAYPRDVSVVGVDLSPAMLRRASMRFHKHGITHVALARMDAQALALPDASFDAVYAPYVVNVVPDPVRVGRELRRVCRPGGRIVLLNHFAGAHAGIRVVDRVAERLAARLGDVDWHVDLRRFLHATGLDASVQERVNFAGVSSVVVCRIPRPARQPQSPFREVP